MPVTTPNSNTFPPRPDRRGASSSPEGSDREDQEVDWDLSGAEEEAGGFGSAVPSLSEDDGARSRGANAEAMGAAPPSRAEASELDKQRTLAREYGGIDPNVAGKATPGPKPPRKAGQAPTLRIDPAEQDLSG